MDKIEKCKYIQNNIDKLCQTENDEIFKILYQNKCVYTQNNNGIFVNLNWLEDEILDKVYNYVSFCLKSQSEMNKYELMKYSTYHSNILSKEKIEEKQIIDDIVVISSNNPISKQSKVSSSMKFYLLKKKFLNKNNINPYNTNNTLTHEEYIFT